MYTYYLSVVRRGRELKFKGARKERYRGKAAPVYWMYSFFSSTKYFSSYFQSLSFGKSCIWWFGEGGK
jgi:hypothetical protein